MVTRSVALLHFAIDMSLQDLSLSFSLGFVMQDQGCKSDAGVKSLIAMVIGAIQKCEVEIDWSHNLLCFCTLQLTSSVLARCEELAQSKLIEETFT